MITASNMKFSSLKDRFACLRDLLKKTQVQMAEELNITQSFLSQMENGSRGISLAVILKVVEKYRINANWLLNGEGTVFVTQKAMAGPAKNKMKGGDTLIPLVDIRARADYPRRLNDHDFIQSFSLYRIPGFEDGNYRMFEIEGDSMEPTIYQGEIVISEYIEDPQTAVNGKIFIIVSKDAVVVKRLLLYLNDSNAFILKSDNPKYKSYQLKSEEIVEIWEVKGKITNHFLNSGDEHGSKLAEMENRIDKLENALKKFIGVDPSADGMDGAGNGNMKRGKDGKDGLKRKDRRSKNGDAS